MRTKFSTYVYTCTICLWTYRSPFVDIGFQTHVGWEVVGPDSKHTDEIKDLINNHIKEHEKIVIQDCLERIQTLTG
ncbi:MAG: hypothetical protein ABIQ02_05590 [Saprospiraceae bacterium]